MAGDATDGLLSQDDVDKALADAGLESGDSGGDAAASDEESQEDVDEPVAAATDGQATDPETQVDSAGRPFDAVAAAMTAAIESEAADRGPAAQAVPLPAGATPMDLPALGPGALRAGAVSNQAIDLLRDVQLNVKIELGRSKMLVEDVLRLGEGSVVELDKLAGDPVDVFVNDRLVARGEVLVLNDNFCVRINDIFQPELEELEQN